MTPPQVIRLSNARFAAQALKGSVTLFGMVYRVRGRHVYPAARHRRPLVLSHLLLQRPRKRVWQVMTSGLSVLALLAVCGLSSYFIVADERQGRDAHASGTEPTQAAV